MNTGQTPQEVPARDEVLAPFIREGDYAVRTPWIWPERRLLDYLLVYVQSGSCLFRVDEQPYKLEGGEVFLAQPGSLVYLEGLTDTVTPFVHFDLFYRPRREESFPTRPGQIDLSGYSELLQPTLQEALQVELPVVSRPLQVALVQEQMLRLVAEWLEGTMLGRLRAHQLLLELLTELIAQHKSEPRQAPHASGALHWVASYMSNRLHKPLQIEEMAARAHLSPSRFRTLFKRDFGMPPHHYLLQLRLAHACELLERTQLSLENVAEYCGFADMQHLSKQFRRRYGMPPGQYRMHMLAQREQGGEGGSIRR